MSNPYGPPSEDEAAAWGGQLPAQVNTLSDALRSAGGGLPLSPQQGTGLPAMPSPVGTPSGMPQGLPISSPTSPPSDFGAALEDYANGQGGGAYPGQGLPLAPDNGQAAVAPVAAVTDPWNRFTPGQPVLPPQYGDLQAMYDKALAESQNPLSRFFTIAGGVDPNAAPFKLLSAMDTMRRQAESDQMARENHMDSMLKSERETWTWVQQQYQQIEDPAQQQMFLDVWAPRLAARANQMTDGTVLHQTLTTDDARKLIATDGGIQRYISARQDADPADLAEAAKIYRTEKDPAKKAEMADAYLEKARVRKLNAAQQAVPGEIRPILAQMTRDNGGVAPTVEDVLARVTDTINGMPEADVRARYKTSKQFALDAIQMFADSTAGQRFFAQSGISTKAETLKALGLTPAEMAQISQTPTFKAWAAANGNPAATESTMARFSRDDGTGFNKARADAQAAALKAVGDQQVRTAVAAEQAKGAALRDMPQDQKGMYVIDTDPGSGTNGQILTGLSQNQINALRAQGKVAVLNEDQKKAHDESLMLDNKLLLFGNTVLPQLAAKPGQNFKVVANAALKQILGDQNVVTDLDSLYSTIISLARSAVGSSNRINQQELAAVAKGLPTAWDTKETAARKLQMLHELNVIAENIRMGRVTGPAIQKQWDAFATQYGLRQTVVPGSVHAG